MKKALSILVLITGLYACDGGKPTPEPEPDEYFSFYADGEYINYPQKKGLGFTGDGQTLKAYILGSTSFTISGYNFDNLNDGQVSMTIPGGHLPDSDTIILTSAGVTNFKGGDNNYEMLAPLSGKIIFSERSGSRLTGTFEFQAYKVYKDISEVIITDTIINITDGNFSIIPTN